MNNAYLYALTGIALFTLGLYALIIYSHLLRKILALNIMTGGVFLQLVALSTRARPLLDAVPHAMVITGIVVAVSATALALALMLRLRDASGSAELIEEPTE
ncbi:MAG: NADH-quinone oxidoreductase subunit K [Gammaproteobacteria bacterium]|nr:NADH-quinone oxidoreductase subunit K [Gammaproteobacteria bacterium]